ncbi:MAG: winged helix-turn-helix transcriptional regulator [Planctomycetota bacterium]
MIPLWKVQEVMRLLDEDQLSQRAIARQLGLSRGTVNALATGKRGSHGRETPSTTEPEAGPPARCPGCGRLVHMPCVWCRAMDYRERARRDDFGCRRAA